MSSDRFMIEVRVEGQALVLPPGETSIGRSLACTVCVSNPCVSRVHASLRRLGDQLVVSDCGSRNGTFVNGAKLGPNAWCVVQPGDDIKLGQVRLEIELVPERSASAQARQIVDRVEFDEERGSQQTLQLR